MTAAGIVITPEFERALRAMANPKGPLLISGSAGVGKSTLLQHFCDQRDHRPVVLAPTGVAALNVGGQTIHRFFGFGVDATPQWVQKSYQPLHGKEKVLPELRTLIIDEVSMVRADLLDCVEIALRRHGPQPGELFGGVNMVFIGDLYQLPPVVRSAERAALLARYATPHFFSADALGVREMEHIELTKVFRQRDREFVDLLHRIRTSSQTPEDMRMLDTRVLPGFIPPEGDQYITLTGTNEQANRLNDLYLGRLRTREHTATARVRGSFPPDSYPTQKTLRFKEGAQVMMLNNDPAQRWVNGTLGMIEDVDEEDGEMSVVVQLAGSGKSVWVDLHEWEILDFQSERGDIVARKTGTFEQYPFRLAWAVTIHKSQGKTFDRMVIDPGQIFASGQAYVAISRCTSFQGLVLTRPLRESAVRVDKDVVRFFENAARPQGAGQLRLVGAQ